MEYTKKIQYQSNYWYNDGLERAKIRDISGAITSLKKSLQYNRSNIASRNLLGLIYFGKGEIAEALVEWIISKNMQSQENIANYYIQKVQETPGELEVMNQAVKKYNQCLIYAQQSGEDLAIIQLKKVASSHPSFLKAHQLLALLYLQTEQYAKARQSLKVANQLDTTNDITLRYMHELTQLRKEKAVKIKQEEKPQTVTYNLGNETIIQPASSSVKEHTGLMTMMNIIIGIVVGVAVMWFLIMPAVNKSTANRANKQVLQFSDKIATQEAQISALKKELEGFRATNQKTEDVQEVAASTSDSYEIVLSVYEAYQGESMSDADMVEQLLKINTDALGASGRTRYDEMSGTIFPRYGGRLYSAAKNSYSAANYEEAIGNLTTVLKMDESYDNGQAMLLLAQSYDKSGDSENSSKWYEKIKEKFPELAAAEPASATPDTEDTEE